LDSGELPDTKNHGRIAKHGYSRYAWCDFFEKLQPFPADAKFRRCKTSDIAAWSRQACDVTAPDRIGDQGKHDRHAPGRFSQSTYDRVAASNDNVRSERNQFRRIRAETSDIRAPAVIDLDLTAID